MKKIAGRIASVAVVLLLTGVLTYYLGMICAPENTDLDLKNIRTFHSMPENTVEVMIYGSSHSWNGVMPETLYREFGIGSYNYSGHWQRLNTTQLFLEDSLRTQTPRVALIETFNVDLLKEDLAMDGEIYYTKWIPMSKRKAAYLRQCFGTDLERYLSYYFPIWMFHDNWTGITQRSFAKMDKVSPMFRKHFGFQSGSSVKKITILQTAPEEEKELPEASRKTLDEMTAACRAKGVEPVLFTLPFSGPFCYGEALKNYAEETGCVYINMFESLEESGISGKTDYFNKGHLNKDGAVKASLFLGEYLQEHYDLTDMRTVEGNIWEQNLPKQ